MRRILVVISVMAIVAISTTMLLSILKGEKSVPMPPPRGGEYLYFKEGEETKIFLVNSSMRYDRYGIDVFWGPPPYSAKKGDSCVVINGTIRNDYDKDYWVCLTAETYNAKGEKVGTVLVVYGRGNKPFHAVAHAKSNGTSNFEIHIKYDGKDVVDYKIFVTCVSEIPPP